jgi:hypothetical protein
MEQDQILNKEYYCFWSHVIEVEDFSLLDDREAFDLDQNQEGFNLVSITLNNSHPWVSSFHVPVEDYLWARNVTRSAKIHLSDDIVLVNRPWKGFFEFVQKFRRTAFQSEKQTHNIIFLVMDARSILSRSDPTTSSISLPPQYSGVYLRDLDVFLLNEAVFTSNLPSWLNQTSEQRARYRKLALIELADLYISISDPNDPHLTDFDQLVLPTVFQTPSVTFSNLNRVGALYHPLESIHYRSPNVDKDKQQCSLEDPPQQVWFSTELEQMSSSSLYDQVLTLWPGFQDDDYKVDILFHSYLNPYSGFGSSAIQMVLGLLNLGLKIRFLPMNDPPPTPLWRSLTPNEIVPTVESTKLRLVEELI